MKKHISALFIATFVFVSTTLAGHPVSAGANAQYTDTLRLMIIGNSFSQNAAKYLKEIAAENDKFLIIGRAELGGCSLERHWNLAEASEADSTHKPYNGKSLKMLLAEQPWDIVTIQQNSMNSTDISTYRPYARQLYDYIKGYLPDAEVVLHQTWAYRADANRFGSIGNGRHAASEREMWQASRLAYHTIAAELGIRLMPVGDAFWYAGQKRKYRYVKDTSFDFDNPVYPALPDQQNSLHTGYHWNKEVTFVLDANHANNYGCYLGSLVWYASLFDKTPEKVKYIPEGMDEKFVKHLRKVAAKVMR